MEKNVFERKVLPVIDHVGAIGAGIMCVAYIAAVFVLINGFHAEKVLQVTIFSIITAAVGLIIMQFLKIQGISFAKNLPENKEILKIYYNSKTKDKKLHSIKYYWLTSVLKDVFIKGATLCASMVGVVIIVIEGSNDYKMLLLAFVNLLMFICFGLLSLSKAYEFFNDRHIPFVKEQIKLLEEQKQVSTEQSVEVSELSEGENQNA